MHKIYRIHPGIGIARLGNSTLDWFNGPDVPDIEFVPAPHGQYRDSDRKIRRQAAAFRIYEYAFNKATDTRPSSVRMITDTDAEIQWHVHLANLKSFTRDPSISNDIRVPNDPGSKTVAGVNQRLEVVGRVFDTDVQLATLMTDEQGILRLLGGFGRSESPSGAPIEGLFSPGWFDDVSDGPVRASVRLRDTGETVMVDPSWAIVGVPAFAAPMAAVVTLYDVAYDIAVRHLGHAHPTNVSFTRDIFPILQRVVLLQWVDPDARRGHGPSGPAAFLDSIWFDLLRDNNSDPASEARQQREFVFSFLKSPDGGGGNMPKLIGPAAPETPLADGLTLTRTQYEQFRRWSIGDFSADWVGLPTYKPFEQLTPLEQTASLDQTGLWTGVGGTFGPGIEVGKDYGKPSTFERPFRIKSTLPAGHLTESLSIPWQADYQACGRGWWPSGRPNSVTADGMNYHLWTHFSGGDAMINAWWKLGFLAKRNLLNGQVAYLETERE